MWSVVLLGGVICDSGGVTGSGGSSSVGGSSSGCAFRKLLPPTHNSGSLKINLSGRSH